MSLEYDADVLEYHAQPAVRVKHAYSMGGRKRAHLATADTFVIRRESAGWEEYKTESRLVTLSAKNPEQYARRDDGGWWSPSGENYAAGYGLYFRVRSDAEIPRRRIRNLDFLEDFLREGPVQVAEDVAGRFLDAVKENVGLTIAVLLSDERLRDRAADLYRLILAGRVYVDLDHDALAEPQRTRVFLDRAAAEAFALRADRRSLTGLDTAPLLLAAGQRFDWDGQSWSVLNVGALKATIDDGQGQLLNLDIGKLEDLARHGVIGGIGGPQDGIPAEGREIYAAANESDLRLANERLAEVLAYLGRANGGGRRPSRAFFNHLRSYRAAEELYGWGYLGLIPRKRDRGNRTARLEARVECLIEKAIGATQTPTAISARHAHRCWPACANRSAWRSPVGRRSVGASPSASTRGLPAPAWAGRWRTSRAIRTGCCMSTRRRMVTARSRPFTSITPS